MWARLTSPFPSEALAWIVAEIEPGRARARVEPAWFPDAVKARLDAQLELSGWSYTLSGVGAAGLVCSLTVGATTRSAVAGSVEGLGLERLADLAFSRCARQFGLAPAVAPHHESYWVEYDPEGGEPLYEPEPVPAAMAAPPGTPLSAAPTRTVPAPESATQPTAGHQSSERSDDAEPELAGEAERQAGREASSEALVMIERLIDRLKAEGLGKEAARLVATHHGGTAEQARELYGRLRALLKQETGS